MIQINFKKTILPVILGLIIASSDMLAEEPEFRFDFQILHANFFDESVEITADTPDPNLILYYLSNDTFTPIRSDPWVPSEYYTYVGDGSFQFYVKDSSTELGYRSVVGFQARDRWDRVLFVIYADLERKRFEGRPVVFTPEQRETPGVHFFNLSAQAMKVNIGGDSIRDIDSGAMAYLEFPPSDDNRFRIQAIVKQGERWRKVISSKRYMDPRHAYFSILCQPMVNRNKYSVRLAILD